MSYFDDASLVMIPSGYKTSKVYSVKPTDGTGDLTFTRSNDTATRVGPDGLIEKVRTNEIINSVWAGVGTNIAPTSWANGFTSGNYESASSSFSENTAIRFYGTAQRRYISQSPSFGGIMSFSFYVESVTITDEVRYVVSQIGGTDIMYLENGVPVSSSTSLSAGNYYTLVFDSSGATQIRLGGGVTTNRTYDFTLSIPQLETGDIATDYIATTSAAVSVGPVANVPRLDYLNSSCPRLLLEPQRTNLLTFSESFNNAAWTKNAVTISANTATSPDGYTNADKIEENTTNTNHRISVGFSFTGPITYTGSCFLKAAERSIGYLYVGTSAFGGDKIAYFNLANGTIGTTSSGTTAKIEDYGNGWYRCSVTATSVSGTLSAGFNIGVSQADGVFSYAGTTGSGILAWGAQLESSASYPSSYIPTLGAAVTRGADAASKTGISSLIGQTEGTLFVEAQFDYNSTTSSNLICVHEGTSAAAISINRESNNRIQLFVFLSSAIQANIITTANSSGTYKIAATYKQNDFKLYVNGVSIGTDTSGNIPAPSVFAVGNLAGSNIQGNVIKQALIFPTALNATQLAELTA